MKDASDTKSLFIKIARILTYIVYAYAVIATVFLILGFILLLFGANPKTGFVNFVYSIASQFLKPFREIFPGQSIGNKGYFSASGLFAIAMYGIGALALHSLITFITLKQTMHVNELRHYAADTATDDQPVREESTRQPMSPSRHGQPVRRV